MKIAHAELQKLVHLPLLTILWRAWLICRLFWMLSWLGWKLFWKVWLDRPKVPPTTAYKIMDVDGGTEDPPQVPSFSRGELW